MMYYLDSKGIYVNDIEDLRDIVTDDIYEAVEGMHNDEIRQLKDECDTGDEIIEEYDGVPTIIDITKVSMENTGALK